MSGLLPHKRARTEAAQSSASSVALTDVNEYSHPKFRAMSELWRAGELCDFTVKVENSEFLCHKLVLASASAYFRGLLPGDRFADSQVHELNGMQAAIFVYVLTFLYDGECSVAVDALLPMLEAAVFLQMESLQQVVAAALMQHLSATNCIIAWNFAERAGLGEMQSAAKAHALVEGRRYLAPDDIAAILPQTAAHRLTPLSSSGRGPVEQVQAMLAATPLR